MLERFEWVDEAVDPRPLRRLALISGSVLVAAVVVLVDESRWKALDLSGAGLVLVWLVVAIAGLLVFGAVSGMLARRSARRRPRLDPSELHDRQVARARLLRGDDLSPGLAGAAQRMIDEAYGRRRTPWIWVVLGAYWAGTAFGYTGHDFWWHLVIGVVYLGLAVWPVLELRRLLRAAARLGMHPSRQRRPRAWRRAG